MAPLPRSSLHSVIFSINSSYCKGIYTVILLFIVIASSTVSSLKTPKPGLLSRLERNSGVHDGHRFNSGDSRTDISVRSLSDGKGESEHAAESASFADKWYLTSSQNPILHDVTNQRVDTNIDSDEYGTLLDYDTALLASIEDSLGLLVLLEVLSSTLLANEGFPKDPVMVAMIEGYYDNISNDLTRTPTQTTRQSDIPRNGLPRLLSLSSSYTSLPFAEDRRFDNASGSSNYADNKDSSIIRTRVEGQQVPKLMSPLERVSRRDVSDNGDERREYLYTGIDNLPNSNGNTQYKNQSGHNMGLDSRKSPSSSYLGKISSKEYSSIQKNNSSDRHGSQMYLDLLDYLGVPQMSPSLLAAMRRGTTFSREPELMENKAGARELPIRTHSYFGVEGDTEILV